VEDIPRFRWALMELTLVLMDEAMAMLLRKCNWPKNEASSEPVECVFEHSPENLSTAAAKREQICKRSPEKAVVCAVFDRIGWRLIAQKFNPVTGSHDICAGVERGGNATNTA